ncbi:MAG: adenosylmethionine decarboxylase [Dehalococcoidia bacterium]|nr:adenosylmethionine decarboxylase [Dehalococcoidia bacterium]MDD5493766.1 adenosylmethionine decarboxylase [Dehalococcoidia bacterium]
MTALGKHLLLELKDCNTELLNDLDYLKEVLVDVARQIGATVIKDSFYQFSPQGISGVVIIAESHISIHTWPEYNFAAVDVFTCGDVIEPRGAVKPLAEKLKAKSTSYIELKRGVLLETGIFVG